MAMMEAFKKHASLLRGETSIFEGIVAWFAWGSLAKLLTYLTKTEWSAEKEGSYYSVVMDLGKFWSDFGNVWYSLNMPKTTEKNGKEDTEI